jgi:MFS family permease
MPKLGLVLAAVGRNRRLRRVVAAYWIFITTEYAVWIAVLVFAYDRGGARAAGLIGLAQLAPAAVAAPLVATIADRHSPARVMVVAYLVQIVSYAAAAVLIWTDGPIVLVYALAIVANTALVAIRPAQAPLVPALATSPSELTAANVVLGWAENVGIVGAGLLTGALLALDGAQSVLAASAAMLMVSLLLVAPLRTRALSVDDEGSSLQQAGDALRILAKSPRPRLLVALITAEDLVLGALDVLFVVLAISVLEAGQAWAGFLNAAFGVGGVLAAGVAAGLVGRRLGRPIILAGALFAATLAVAPLVHIPALMLVLMAFVGASRAVFDTATRTLLQRAVPSDVLGRVFGVVEGLSMVAIAVGTVGVPVLIAFGGSKAALLGAAAVMPIAGLLGIRSLLRLDEEALVPVVEIALLRSLRIFANLSGPATEGVARAMERVDVHDGQVLMREGEPGHTFYAICDGTLAIERGGKDLGLRGRGDGVGEIALLRSIPRTATVTAVGDATLYELDRDTFLTAVAGHRPTADTADRVIDERLRDEDPGGVTR